MRWLLSLPPWPTAGGAGGPRLTVIRHHRVYAPGDRPLYRLGVTERVLEAQVATCIGAGLTPCTVRDGLTWLASASGGRRVAFSFDDGYVDNLERALPVLQRHGAHATLYLAAGLMESRQAPWWDELAFVLAQAANGTRSIEFGGQSTELALHGESERRAVMTRLLPAMRVAPAHQRALLDSLREQLSVSTEAPCELATLESSARWAEAGMELGAHTLTHPFLSTLEADAQREEIVGSAKRIREVVGADVVGLAFPNGDHDERTLRAMHASGLEYSVTTQSGDIVQGADRFTLPRRGLPEGAVLGPGGRFSPHMTRAEISGRFDRLRAGSSGAST